MEPRDDEDETRTLRPAVPPEADTLRIDGYVIRQRIGEGGFGQVYLAEQIRPVQRSHVAIKVIKPGMDTRQVLARFEAEKQALALMSHPSIAKVLDAGITSGGRPYFVMEYIKGVPLTSHCDRHTLGIDERLRLFLSICDAVHHAHQKGIIHRDIKPSNILVSYEEGPSAPKIIDFGVAKALGRPLTEGLSYTDDGRVIGTPEYMSPEQVDPTRQDIDTRSDIYSLGVLLYELLVGARPFEQAALQGPRANALREAIRDVVPPRPSRRLSALDGTRAEAAATARQADAKGLRRRLRGDLDRITMMCLAKDRARRYETALELARDVERHLRNEPVRAVPPSVSYRTRKFVARHRMAVAMTAAMAVLVILAAGLGLAARRSARERAHAEARLVPGLVEKARMLAYRDPEEALRLLASAAALDPSSPLPPLELARLAQLRPDEDAALREAERVATRFPDSVEAVGLLAGALRARDPEASRRYRDRAEELLKRQAGSPSKARARLLSALAFGESDRSEAIRLFTESLDGDPWNFESLWQRAVRLLERSQERARGADTEGAREDLDAALEDADLMTRIHDDLAMTWTLHGASALERGKLAGEGAGAADLDRALASFDRAVALEPDDWISLYDRALCHGRRHELEQGLADLDEAIRLNPEERRLFAERGKFCFELGRHAEAVAALTRAIELGDRSWSVHMDRGMARFHARDFAGANEDYEVALEAMAADEAVLDADRASVLSRRGDARLALGRWSEAREDGERALALDPMNPVAHLVVGKALLRGGARTGVAPHFERAHALAPDGLHATYRLERGIALWRLGDADRAIDDLRAYAGQDDGESSWIWLWVWEIEALRGHDAAAARALEAAARSSEPLLRLVLESRTGHVDPFAVLDSCKTDEERLSAAYHLGVIAFVEGRRDDAAGWLRKCTALGLSDWMEHDLALWHLARLEAGDST